MSLQDVAPDGVLAEAITTVQEQMDKITSLLINTKHRLALHRRHQKCTSGCSGTTAPDYLLEVQTPAIDLGEPPLFNQIGLRIPDSPVFNSIDHLLQELDLSDLQIPAAPEFPAIQLPENRL